MNVADVLKLSLGGYSKEQIRELSTMSKEAPEIIDYVTKNGKSFDEAKELFDFSKELAGDASGEPSDPKPDESDPNGLDSRIKELETQNEALNNTIKQMQSDNLNKDHSGDAPDPMAELNNLVADFM